MRRAVLWGAAFFCLSLVLQYVWLHIQRRVSLTQAQKSYGVGIDVEVKAATPSMGGAVFLVLALLGLASTNMPVKMALEKDATNIIAVDLEAVGLLDKGSLWRSLVKVNTS